MTGLRERLICDVVKDLDVENVAAAAELASELQLDVLYNACVQYASQQGFVARHSDKRCVLSC
jgi:hypothetical protein